MMMKNRTSESMQEIRNGLDRLISQNERIDRYLRISNWLRKRYRSQDGTITTHLAHVGETKFTRLSNAFWNRYIAS